MSATLTIDFVSDISCPWCIVGLRSLERALTNAADAVSAELRFQPFELNPDMNPEGQEIATYLSRKLGVSPEQLAENQEMIRARGAELGFTFNMDKRTHIYNTFDAHRLLHWAHTQGASLQHALKSALFAAYFTDGRNPSDREVLVELAAQAGLDPVRAREVLESDEFAQEVREREEFYRAQGVNAVPSVIINSKYLIQGGQPPELFERALRQIAAEAGGEAEAK
jgi:predicted DsbA family dithiol-disulfide isomerase